MNDKIDIKNEKQISLAFFNNPEYSSMFLEIPKIFFDEANKAYTLVSSFLIERSKTPEKISDLKAIEKEHIAKTRKFVDFYNGKTKQQVKSLIVFYFPKDNENSNQIITVSSDDSLEKIDISKFKSIIQTLNGEQLTENSANEIKNRKDDSINSLFSILTGTPDNSLPVDKILHLGFSKQALFFSNIEPGKTAKEHLEQNYDKISNLYDFTKRVLSPVFLSDKDLNIVQADNFKPKEYSVELQPKKPLDTPRKEDTENKKNKKDNKDSPQMNLKF